MAKLDIEALIRQITEKGELPTIGRKRYMPYKMEVALSAIEALGKVRNAHFVIDESNRFTYANFVKWIHGDSSFQCLHPTTKQVIQGDLCKGIYIAGGTGTGKSWCLEIMSSYCLADNPIVKLGEETRLLKWVNVRTDTICDTFSDKGDIQKYKTIPIIGFQDLGAEQEEAMYMGNRLNVMKQILEYRGDCTDKITLVTSNLPFTHKQFSDRYGVRCVSRMHEMFNYFEIKGKDRRIQR